MSNLARNIYHRISSFLSSRGIHLIGTLQYSQRKTMLDLRRMDYIRISSLELCAHEIKEKQIMGNVAELGVYRGDFAKDINHVFGDRLLYLFDTFEGFDNRDVKIENKHSLSNGSQDFSDTNIELVLSKMQNKDKCIICKGFFPTTAENIDDQFCFVSIDADLYQPIADGLNYFYPRLSTGGYIFIHDYNNDEYPGAKKAVKEFCTKQNISYIPIADVSGTVIITK